METRKPAKSLTSYEPRQALTRLRFYLDVVEAHLGAGDERRRHLQAMEAEADRRHRPSTYDIAEDRLMQKDQEDSDV